MSNVRYVNLHVNAFKKSGPSGTEVEISHTNMFSLHCYQLKASKHVPGFLETVTSMPPPHAVLQIACI